MSNAKFNYMIRCTIKAIKELSNEKKLRAYIKL